MYYVNIYISYLKLCIIKWFLTVQLSRGLRRDRFNSNTLLRLHYTNHTHTYTYRQYIENRQHNPLFYSSLYSQVYNYSDPLPPSGQIRFCDYLIYFYCPYLFLYIKFLLLQAYSRGGHQKEEMRDFDKIQSEQ